MTFFTVLKKVVCTAAFALAIFAGAKCPAGLMYFNAFPYSEGTLSDWTVLKGGDAWNLLDPNGYNYSYEDPGTNILGLSVYTGGTLTTGNYSVSTNFSRTNDNYGGIVFRYQDASNFYLGRIALSQTLQLYKFSGGTATLLGETPIAEPNLGNSENWTLVTSANGNKLSVAIYNEEDKFLGAVTKTDSTFSNGTFGFRNDPGYTYNNVIVQDPFTVPTAQIINAVADTYVSYDSRASQAAAMDTNYGTLYSCEVKSATDATDRVHRKAYFKFDVSSLEDAGGVSFLVNAYGNDSRTRTFKLYGLLDGVGDDWGQTTITWNNAPGNTADSIEMDPTKTVLLGTFNGAIGGSDTTFGGASLAEFLNADSDGLVTLIVTADEVLSPLDYPTTAFRSLEYGAAYPNWLVPARLRFYTGGDALPQIPTQIPGDANMDGKVDNWDARILATNWLTDSGATWGMGDFNNDGKVNDVDATMMASNWLNSSEGSNAVPEPCTAALLALGLLCLAAVRAARMRR